MNLRESIRTILKEETHPHSKVRRRIGEVNWRVHSAIKDYDTTYKTKCIGFQNYIEVISNMVTDSMYWDLFASEMDEDSKEWYDTYVFLSNYIEEKYIFELKKHYNSICGE